MQTERWVFILKVNVLEAKPQCRSHALPLEPLWLAERCVSYIRLEFLSKINWEFGSWCPESLPLQQAAERTGHLPSCGIILFSNPNKRPCWNMTSMSDEKNAPLFLRNSFQRTSRAIYIAKSFIRNFCRRSFISYQKPWDRAEVLVVQIACPLCQLWTQQPPVFG